MSGPRKLDTSARFLHLAGQQLTDEHNQPIVNDTIDKDTGAILRFKNGFLDGGSLPAVECEDSHMEFYRNGKLHRDKGPAVISDYGKVKEFWTNGRRIS
jgi:hypothetical protein